VELSRQRDEEELEVVMHRLAAAKDKLQEARVSLEAAVRRFEEELVRKLDEYKAKECAGFEEEWNQPTADEAQEDQQEDLRLAMEETEAATRWVPRDITEVGTWWSRISCF
jgi:transcriptional regulator of NAD metabolism